MQHFYIQLSESSNPKKIQCDQKFRASRPVFSVPFFHNRDPPNSQKAENVPEGSSEPVLENRVAEKVAGYHGDQAYHQALLR